MMKFLLAFLLSFPFLLSAQNILYGTVHSNTGEVLVGANVYLPATYEGATVDTAGQFNFKTFSPPKRLPGPFIPEAVTTAWIWKAIKIKIR